MKTIDLTKLHNAEHLALMTELQHLISDSKLPPFEELKKTFIDLVAKEEAQKQIVKSQYTENLADLDKKRYELYRGMVLRIQSELYFPKEERQKSARKIQIVLDTYGKVSLSNYEKETIELQNLIIDLKASAFAKDIRTTGILEWIAELERANNEFHTVYTMRRDEYASKVSYDMKSIRRDLDIAFKRLREITTAMKILQPSEELNVLINKANVTINKWRDIIAQRNSKKND
ncbi:MAG: DUF6261 family protein [Bacteroidota bacterium]|nr:DUF6261 family protein [Bacteroidota bacterium]